MTKRMARLVFAVLAVAPWAAATEIELGTGSGWFVDLPAGVTIPAGSVSMGPHYVKLDLEKDITTPPDEYGDFDAIEIVFRRTEDAPTRLIIGKEIVTNHTGVTWTDFHIALGTNSVGFDSSIGTPSGTPFTHVTFSHFYGYGDGYPVRIDFDGGTVPANGTFRPGETSGDIVIVTRPQAVTFVLKEWPTVPEPLSMVLLAVGGMFLRRRV